MSTENDAEHIALELARMNRSTSERLAQIAASLRDLRDRLLPPAGPA